MIKFCHIQCPAACVTSATSNKFFFESNTARTQNITGFVVRSNYALLAPCRQRVPSHLGLFRFLHS